MVRYHGGFVIVTLGMIARLVFVSGLYAQGKDVTKYATMLKLKAGRLGREIPDACLQFWGGMGYTDIEISRMYRDFRLMSIGGGADEVMLGVICKFMGTLPKM